MYEYYLILLVLTRCRPAAPWLVHMRRRGVLQTTDASDRY